ncbi:MAG TPA: DUF86 domain-containing protein [Anaerolineales bacterium]
MHRDEVVIQDIVNAARLVTEFVKGFDKTTFIHDWKTRSAVRYQPTVIGEAVKRLSKEFRGQYPEIPWTLIAGMRDNLIHGYDLIDWDEVWKTSTVDVPDLSSRMEAFIKK